MNRVRFTLSVSALLTFALAAQADPVTRVESVSNGLSQGDMWSFKCPNGGTFDLTVDTAGNLMDPEFGVFDGDGNQIANSDDAVACSNSCAASCPQVLGVACGRGTHYIVVQNFGSGSTTCPGGGYSMTLEGFDKNGDSVDAKKLKLGGGAKQKVPKFLDPDKLQKEGPLVDDGQVPGI